MSNEIHSHWVMSTIKHADAFDPKNKDILLSILTRALVHAGRTLGVSKEILVDNLEQVYDEKKPEVVKQ